MPHDTQKPDTDAAPRQFVLPMRLATMVVALACLLPNLNALVCGFLFDDLPLIVENVRIHRIANIPGLWRSGYWPDRPGLTLYRPFTQSVWSVLWWLGNGAPSIYHALNLLLATAVALLLFHYLVRLGFDRLVAFAAALLFALFPIHTEAVTAIVGSSELLAALFGLGALYLHRGGRRIPALILFALAIFSKESAAALAGIAFFATPRPRRRFILDGVAAAAIIGVVVVMRSKVRLGPDFIPPIDNATSLVSAGPRLLTALWTQCLYVWKTLVPITLSADYSYREIPLVMNLGDVRAWAGLGLAAAALWTVWRRRDLAPGVLAWGILFSPTANILFPIATAMGERLAYLPSAGLALLLAQLCLASSPAAPPREKSRKVRREIDRAAKKEVKRAAAGGKLRGQVQVVEADPPVSVSRKRVAVVMAALAVVTFVYGARSWVRNRDWKTADAFYTKLLETSPNSAKTHYFYGTMLSARGADELAVAAYNRAVAIFPAYPEAFNNRGNALTRLGRYPQAMESYRSCLRFDPGHRGAQESLTMLELGVPFTPPRGRL